MSFRSARLSRTAVMASLLTAALAAIVWQSGVQAQLSLEQAERAEAQQRRLQEAEEREAREQAERREQQERREQAERKERLERERQEALERAARSRVEQREQEERKQEHLRRFHEQEEQLQRHREVQEELRRRGAERGAGHLPLSEEQLAELQEQIHRATARHPRVASARARLEQAEAELRQTSLEAATEALEIHAGWLQAEREVDALQALKGRTADERDLEQRLASARRRLTEMNLRRRFLLGEEDEEREEHEAEHEHHGRQWPAGPMADRLARALNQPLNLEFVDTPVRDVTSFLADTLEIPFHLDRQGLEEAGLEATMPLNINVSDVSVGAGLQALTDLHRGLAFVVTDYGILLTAREGEMAERYLPAHAFWRETLEDGEDEGHEEAEDAAEDRTPRPESPARRGAAGDLAEPESGDAVEEAAE